MKSSDDGDEITTKGDRIGAILVVDDDEGVRNSVAAHLRKLGAERIDEAEDGEDAWSRLQSTNYDLVITDWKMPKASGLALANRIRQLDSVRYTPLLVLTGYLNRSDFSLLSEFPLVATLEKPYEFEDFAKVISKLQAEGVFYLNESTTVNKVFAESADNAMAFVGKLIALIKSSVMPVPLAVKGSRILQDHGHLDSAESILKIVLTADPGCVVAMHELGKCYLRQRRYDEARSILGKAHELCPTNLERLCLLGKVNISSENYEDAKGNFQDALKIDSADQRARQGLIAARAASDAFLQTSREGIKRTFVSAVNARAIAKIHGQKFSEAIELYQSAMEYADEAENQIKLAYNLGLAYWRWQKPEEALKWFHRSVKLSSKKFSKAANSINQIYQLYGLTYQESGDDDSAAFADLVAKKGADGKHRSAPLGAVLVGDDDLPLDEAIQFD